MTGYRVSEKNGGETPNRKGKGDILSFPRLAEI
jgi:hypothetical protein